MDIEKIIRKLVAKVGLKRIYQVFSVVRWLYMTITDILDTLTGYSLVEGWEEERRQARSRFDKSGHVVRVLARASAHISGFGGLENFIFRHEAFVDPADYVLNNANVTLMGVSQSQVWFCITEPEVSVFGLGKFPFAYMAQFFMAKKILFIPISSLKQLGEKVGDPSGDCVMINNTGRCGSTLLCQMFGKLPDTVVMSEPWAMNYAHKLYNSKALQWNVYLDMIQALVRLEFKRTEATRNKRIILKLPMFCAPQFKPIHELFGQKIKLLFSTRHPRPSMLSFAKIVKFHLKHDLERRAGYWYGQLAMPYTPEYSDILDKYLPVGMQVSNGESLAISHGAVMANFLLDKKIYTHAITYEEMMEDIQGSTMTLFDKLGIDASLVPQAITALNKHSQNNLFGSNNDNPDDLITKTDWEIADEIFKDLRVPLSTSMTNEELFQLVH